LRCVILHYHILKNAGTTLENILDRNFGERFARLDTEHRDGRIEQSAIVEYLDRHHDVEAISSHQIHYPVPQARGYLFFDWCFLRDPIDRLRSTYDYFRQHPSDGDPLSEAANRLEFGPYVRCLLDRFPEQVDNPQTNLLANGAADRETFSSDFEPALRRMLEIVFLGVVDLYQQSIAAGRYRMRAVFPWLDFTATPANVSRGMEGSPASRRLHFRDTVGRGVYREVVRLNMLDLRLLRAARAEVRRRSAMVPPVTSESRPPAAVVKPSRLPWALRREDERNRRQGIFDADFYLEKYPDVRAAGIDPLRHYVEHGAAEGRKPHRLFDTTYYLRQRPEARAPGVDALVDFLEGGARVANPHPLFDCAGDAQRLVDYVKAKRPAQSGATSIVVSDEALDSSALQQRAFFDAVCPDQLRAQ
jgi:Sulfotransferase family